MNTKIILSLSVIAVVAAIGIGGTIAYFSDTETSEGNTFTAGTIDISINDQNPWDESFSMTDMKPCYTDYINFKIQNSGSDPNPVNVWKHLEITQQNGGAVSEPECTEQGGDWTGTACIWGATPDNNNIASIIDYDLRVEVYGSCDELLWWQTIYDKEVTVEDIECNDIYLGMIPAGGYMKVEQSYHMQDPDTSTNWAQGDVMAFNIEIEGIQLRGTAWLENKDYADDTWKIIHGDGIKGTLEYVVKNPTFDFSFTGKALLTNHNYYLIAGWKLVGTGYDVDTVLGSGTTDGSGNITIIEDVELSKHMKDVKVWLVPTENWNGSEVTWGGWPGCVDNFLWETGLIWYEDTDL